MGEMTYQAPSEHAEDKNGKARSRKVLTPRPVITSRVVGDVRPNDAAIHSKARAETPRQGDWRIDVDAKRERLQRQQIWLLTFARGIFQMARICFGPLVVSMTAEYDYSPVEKGMVLSAFSSGYALTQILGGLAADYLGGKPLLVLGLLTSAGSLLLVPVAADAGIFYLWWLLWFMGFAQGPTYPAQQVTQAKWATTVSLRSFAGNLGGAGSTLGSLLALGLTPFLDGRIGWRRTAWFFGTVTALVGFLEVCMGSSAPSWAHQQSRDKNASSVESLSSATWLWRRLRVLLALPVIAVFVAHSVHNFIRYFLVAWMPTYYSEVLQVSQDASGLHMIIPEFCGLLSSIAIASLGLGSKLSPLSTRRLFSSIAFMGSFVGLLLVSTVRTPALVTFFLCFVQGLATLQGLGWGQSYSEVSRYYVGLVTGVGNTVATVASWLAPVFASSLISEESPKGSEAWRMMFLCFASTNLVGLGVYSYFCSVTPVDVDEDVDNNSTKPHAE